MDRDPTTTNPDLYKVVLENDRVRVLEYRRGCPVCAMFGNAAPRTGNLRGHHGNLVGGLHRAGPGYFSAEAASGTCARSLAISSDADGIGCRAGLYDVEVEPEVVILVTVFRKTRGAETAE